MRLFALPNCLLCSCSSQQDVSDPLSAQFILMLNSYPSLEPLKTSLFQQKEQYSVCSDCTKGTLDQSQQVKHSRETV